MSGRVPGLGSGSAAVAERARNLNLLRELAVSQAKIRDQHTTLGFLWSFLHPLLLLVCLYVIFHGRLGSSIPNYTVYMLIGIVHFAHFSKSTGAGMRALHRMKNMAANAIFPKEILVFASVLSDAPEFAISVGVAAALALFSGVPLTPTLLALPLAVLLQLTVVLWIALAMSIVRGFVHDIDHIYEVGMRILFFATPIFYDSSMLSPLARRLMMFNPLAHLIDYSRTIVLGGSLPAPLPMLGFLAVNLLLARAALVLFRRAEPALLERM